jgi:hypothetical protein
MSGKFGIFTSGSTSNPTPSRSHKTGFSSRAYGFHSAGRSRLDEDEEAFGRADLFTMSTLKTPNSDIWVSSEGVLAENSSELRVTKETQIIVTSLDQR